MIFVDTSVWVDFLRGKNEILVKHLHTLLDEDRIALSEPVWCELLSGCSKQNLAVLERALSSLPRFFPTEHTWPLIEGWIRKSVIAGHRFGFADLLIAAIASENGGQIWSLDGDFAHMELLKFVRSYPGES